MEVNKEKLIVKGNTSEDVAMLDQQAVVGGICSYCQKTTIMTGDELQTCIDCSDYVKNKLSKLGNNKFTYVYSALGDLFNGYSYNRGNVAIINLEQCANDIYEFISNNKLKKPCSLTFEMGFLYMDGEEKNTENLTKHVNRKEKKDWDKLVYYKKHLQMSYGLTTKTLYKLLQDSQDVASNRLESSNMRYLGLQHLSITITKKQLAQVKDFWGGKYSDLPAFFDKSNNIVNVKNGDEKCFLWSLLANDYLKLNLSMLKNKNKRGKFKL